ncbi:hypothetical protein [Alkalihalobacillus sp. TS-13]|uniref:hypothetical protein n=1 Tax=Alkalihalobacillus sp. TS-13 TaxID=2842455 RepID=UPI001C887F46|nr:hypothetical protein [Alkalihalobacillus sp. TS-13]
MSEEKGKGNDQDDPNPESSEMKEETDSVTFQVEGEEINLKRSTILSDQVEILLPESFDVMDEEQAKLKYPGERRPTLIYTNENATVNIAFNHTENKASNKQMEEVLKGMVETFENMYPSAEWLNKEVYEIHGKNVASMELITPAMDTEIYNFMFMMELDGKLLLATVNSTKEQMEDWQPIAKEMMKSINMVD